MNTAADAQRARIEYRTLVESIAAQRDEFRSIADLPLLTDAQRGLVLAANPDVMNDVTLEPADLAAIYAAPDSSLLGLYRRLGFYLSVQLRPHLLAWILEDVQAECEAERERLQAARYEGEYGEALFT